MEFTTDCGNTFTLCKTVLGVGHRSEVRIGVEKKSLERVAIKIVQKTDANVFKKMQREFNILRKLQGHKNIIRLVDFAETPQAVALVFEKHSRTLLDFVCSGGHLQANLSLADCSRVFREIVGALCYGRLFNVSHLDLKLENIMLDKENSAVIIDFGFAEETEPGQKLVHGRGSCHYMSPEIIKKSPFDPEKADVWSLGIILYALAIGLLPFGHPTNNVEKIFEQISAGKFYIPTTVAPVVTDLLSHMIEVDTQKRYDLVQVARHPFLMLSETS